MNINEMWELLETEPTSDKKLIKQAYARAVKKYHPEENPEEFQKVYAAYKQAMAAASGKPVSHQAEDALNLVYQLILRGQPEQETRQEVRQEEKKEEQEKPPREQGTTFRNGEEEQIQELFREMKNQHERKFFIFRQKWQWYLKNREKEDAEKEMREYIKTSWFQDIMEEPAVLTQLAVGFDRCQNCGGLLKEDIWELYSLGNPKTPEEKSRHRALFHVLVADQERFLIKQRQESAVRKRMIQAQIAENNIKLHKAWRKLGLGLAALIVLTSVLIGIEVYSRGGFGRKNISQEKEQAEIFSYLQENYPMGEFDWPQPLIEETEAQYVDADLSGRNYRVKEKNFDITANVYTLQKNGKILIGEDFGRQYMWQLGEKWGLICDLCRVEEPWTDGKTHNLMVGEYEISSDLSVLRGELREYMERFREFAQSEEVREFVNIEGVSFCVSNCFCPKAFIMEAGGVPEPLLYDLNELPEPEVMAEDMAENITDYYIHMEPWQLEHDPLYDQWLASYEDKVKELNIEPSTPAGNAVLTIAEELGVQVVLCPSGESECISLGDLYRMAKRSDYPPSVLADGSGFRWKNGPCSYDETGDGWESRYTCDRIVEMFAEE